MKRQQVISRFFAPKSVSSSSSARDEQSEIVPTSASTCPIVEWPSSGCNTVRTVKQGLSPGNARSTEEEETRPSLKNVYSRKRRAPTNSELFTSDGFTKVSGDGAGDEEQKGLKYPCGEVSTLQDREGDNEERDEQRLELTFCCKKKRTQPNRAEQGGRRALHNAFNKKPKDCTDFERIKWKKTNRQPFVQSNASYKPDVQRENENSAGSAVDIPGIWQESSERIPVAKRNSTEESEIGFESVSNGRNLFHKESDVGDTMIFPASDPLRHKKFVDKLLARTDENRTSEDSRNWKVPFGKDTYTPLELQVVELKAKYKDILLMVEVGYRYRFFGEDAEIAARTLGIFAHNDHNFLTASIPTFRLHVHVRRLVEAGYKVGVVRQTEMAAMKAHGGNKVGPFSRSLSALYTRATLEAAKDLGGEVSEGARLSSYLMCIVEKCELPGSASRKSTTVPAQVEPEKMIQIIGGKETEGAGKGAHDTTIGVIAVETATGDVMYGYFRDTVMRVELEACLLTCSPAELLLATPLSSATEKILIDFAGPSSNICVERMPRDCFDSGGAVAEVLSFYGAKDLEKKRGNNALEAEDQKVDEGMEAVMGMPELVTQALALALRYLKQFGLERILQCGTSFRPFTCHGEMNLSSNALQQLEILQNSTDGTEKGSLLWLMNHTQTACGSRLFRHWLTHPLCERSLIASRLDAVSEIVASMGSVCCSQNEGSFPGSGRGGGNVGAASRVCADGGGKQGLLASVLVSLKRVPDLERGITRIFHRTATPSEFVSVIEALLIAARQLQRLCFDDDTDSGMVDASMKDGKSGGTGSELLKRLLSTASSPVVCEHSTRFLCYLNKEAAAAGDKHNLFICASGRFPSVFKCHAAVRKAEELLDTLLCQYCKLLKMPSLQYMGVSGTTHLLELPVMQRVPSNWIKISSTQKTHRYHTPEVLKALEALALAKEELTVECGKTWDTFLAEFSSHYADFRAAIHAIAALDCLYSLAIVSRNQGYVRPEFVEEIESPQLMIKGGRHPVLESYLQDGFVPNDTFLHAEGEHCQIITGPNMGGKSCYIRQVALIAIMAQVGSYVPAASAKLNVFDAVYTRMGASDNIQRGSSTFLEELSEASVILQRATRQSLVIMDELGRGTSTHDGVAIAYATLQHVLTEIRCLTLFVTHYLKIAESEGNCPGSVGPYFVSYIAEHPLLPSLEGKLESGVQESSMNEEVASGQDVVDEAKQKVTFLYKLVRGVASRSFGLHVARLAQIPEACVQRAAVMSTILEKKRATCTTQATDFSRHPKETTWSEESILTEKKKRELPCPVNPNSLWGNNLTVNGLGDFPKLQCRSNHNVNGVEGRKLEEMDGTFPIDHMDAIKKKDCVFEVLCLVGSALKLISPEEGFSALKKVQESAIRGALLY